MSIFLLALSVVCLGVSGMPTRAKDTSPFGNIHPFGNIIITHAPVVEADPQTCGRICQRKYESCKNRNKEHVVGLEMCTSEFTLCYPRCYFADLSLVKFSTEAECVDDSRERYNECRRHSPVKVLKFPCREEYRTARDRCIRLFSSLSPTQSAQRISGEALVPTGDTPHSSQLSGPSHRMPIAAAMITAGESDYKPCWSDCLAYYTMCIQQVRQFEDILICQRARTMCRNHPTCFRRG